MSASLPSIRSAIRQSLLTTVATFNSTTATAEQAELAAAQIIAADELLADQAGSAFAETLSDPNSPWKVFWKSSLSHTPIELAGSVGSFDLYPNIVNGQMLFAGRLAHSSVGVGSNSVSITFASGDLNGEKALTSYSHVAAAFSSNPPPFRVALDPVRGPYMFGNDSNVGSYYYSRAGQATGPNFQLRGFGFHREFGRAIIVGAGNQVQTSTDSQTGYTNANLPSMVGITLNANSVIMMTPTAVLIPTVTFNNNGPDGFLRSTDGVTYVLIPGAPMGGVTTAPATSEFFNGRLYLCTSRGLWSTADNGTTWRNDIPTTADIEQLFTMSDGRLLAVGPGGIWHGAADGTGFTRVSTVNPPRPRMLAADQRLIYAANGLYTENGTLILAASSLDWNIGRFTTGNNVASGPNIGSDDSDQLTPASTQIIPDGPNSLLLMKNVTTDKARVIRQMVPVYVPPRTGQRVRIVAIGAGGDLISTGNTSFAGRSTTVSNLIVAAGGPVPQANLSVLGNVGSLGISLGPQTGSTPGERFIVRGGAGLVMKGRRFGDGMSLECGSTFGGDNIQSVSASGIRGGTGAIPAILTAVITDPVPMVIPAARYSRMIRSDAVAVTGGDFRTGLRGAEMGEAPGGAVAILEI